MVIDTSALLAILLGEKELREYIEIMESAASRAISVANLVEVSIVIESRLGGDGLRDLDLFVERAGIEVIEVDLEQGRLARRAYGRFGKGRHPAGLNYGDCFAYALAMARGEPLLYKGDDFSKTDVVRVFRDASGG